MAVNGTTPSRISVNDRMKTDTSLESWNPAEIEKREC